MSTDIEGIIDGLRGTAENFGTSEADAAFFNEAADTISTLREALEFAREWATGLGQVSFDDRAAFVAQIDRALLPKDKP